MHHLSREELTRLLSVAKDHDRDHHIMFLATYYHGLRTSEIINVSSLDIFDGRILVKRLKGSEKTIQPLIWAPDSLWDEKTPLEQFARERQGKLFPMCRNWFYKLMRKYCAVAEIPRHKAHPHILKTTCGMLAIRNQMPIEELRQYLGHKSLASTGYYLRSDDDTASEAFAKAITSKVNGV